MEEVGEKTQEEVKKEKLKNWLNEKQNLLLIGIVILGIILRLYYFFLTKNQPLWWDELSFGSLAKNFFVYSVPNSPMLEGEKLIRPYLFPVLWGLLIKIGFSEVINRFFLELVPSIISIFLVYKIGKTQYDKRYGLIGVFIFAILWMPIFYTMRLLTSIPALMLSLFSIYFFIKSSEELKIKYFAASIAFLSLSILMRYSFGIVGFVYLAFLAVTQRGAFLKKKSFWKGGVIGAIPLIFFFLFNFFIKGTLFPAVGAYTSSAAEKTEYAFYTWGFIKHILQTPLYWIFLLGLTVCVFNLILRYSLIKKDKNAQADFFTLVLFVFTLIFLVFIVKYSEDRYLFECVLAVIALTSKGILFLYDQSRKYSKKIGVVFIGIILIWGAYSQITFGDSMINTKKQSYLEMKQAFTWLNENTPKETKILGEDVDLYTIYYAERMPQSWPVNKSNLSQYEIDTDYIVLNAFHGNSEEVQTFLNSKPEQLQQAAAFFFDKDKKQPAVILLKYIRKG